MASVPEFAFTSTAISSKAASSAFRAVTWLSRRALISVVEIGSPLRNESTEWTTPCVEVVGAPEQQAADRRGEVVHRGHPQELAAEAAGLELRERGAGRGDRGGQEGHRRESSAQGPDRAFRLRAARPPPDRGRGLGQFVDLASAGVVQHQLGRLAGDPELIAELGGPWRGSRRRGAGSAPIAWAQRFAIAPRASIRRAGPAASGRPSRAAARSR